MSPADLAWSVVERLLDDELSALRSKRVWVAQPEFSPSCLAVLKELSPKSLEIFQSFRPEVRAFEKQGFRSSRELSVGPFDLAICVPTRQRTESLALMAHGLLHLSPKGFLLFVCANTQGASGFLSRMREIYPTLEAESSKKCRWVLLPAPSTEQRVALEVWVRDGATTRVPGTEFRTLPGIYGWNKVDRGSELLVSTLPKDLAGFGADLGSGYGFLSYALLGQNAAIETLYVVEAEARALDCARENLSVFGERCSFHWLDVSAEETHRGFKNLDWVVMNPPFHDGPKVDAGVGRAFIETAARLLKPGARLFMVANAFLGYEEILRSHFSLVSRVLERDGFKVIHGVR